MSATLTPLPCSSQEMAASTPTVCRILPFPIPSLFQSRPQAPANLPPCPSAPGFPRSAPAAPAWSAPIAAFPTVQEITHPAPTPLVPYPLPLASHGKTPPLVATPPKTEKLLDRVTASEFTDDDLRDAFAPIMEQAVRKAVYAKENGIDTYLEPMLRATIRRALAEYAPSTRPFHGPGTLDRLVWHMQSLFTSRTYEDILFEKTRRFQIEEVFLLDIHTLALVSFASCDPARHASAHRVANTVHRLALQLRDDTGTIQPAFNLPDGRIILTKTGNYVALIAMLRGTPGVMLHEDLSFALRRIEDHFRLHFQQEGSELLYSVQPFLEDCLLIQAPAITG